MTKQKPFDLSKFKFTQKADKVESKNGIINPVSSNVKTLRGADKIIGNKDISSDFGFGVLAEAEATNGDAITSADLSSKATINADGIRNKGSISTNRGRDILRGSTTVEITAISETVSEAIAYANKLDTNAIAETFASVDIMAVANGINNSGGEIATGKGSDTVDGELKGSIAAVATATADATAVVEGIAKAPMTKNLKAFAGAIAQSLANATIAATGIKNIRGKLTTGVGADTISANATSESATLAEASTSALSGATTENEALAMAVAEAIATTQDKAIGINNKEGDIGLGRGSDTINANADATDKAIGIKNNQGTIKTGKGDDTIEANATGLDSFGIFGGTIHTGDGKDKVDASSFGGGVNIRMGDGKDFVEGFGDAIVNGGNGFDTFSLDSFKIEDFNISLGANNNKVLFELDDIIMTTTKFEQFNFDNGSLTLTYEELATTV